MPGLWRLGQGAWKGGSGNEADSRQNNRPHCSRGGRPPPSPGGHGRCPGGALPAAADAGSLAGEWTGPPSGVPPPLPESHRQHRQAPPPRQKWSAGWPRAPAPLCSAPCSPSAAHWAAERGGGRSPRGAGPGRQASKPWHQPRGRESLVADSVW